MKNLPKKLLAIIIIALIAVGCKNSKNASTPSIANNSNHLKKEAKADYSSTSSEKLLKEAKAHYELSQYSIAKEKLVYLQKTHQDSLDGIDLNVLKNKIDAKLSEIQKRIQEKNKLAQNERLSMSLEKMRYEQEKGQITYYDSESPKFSTKECFYAYIVLKNSKPKLFFRIRYIANEYLNIQDYIINVDKLDYTFTGDIEKSKLKGKKEYTVEMFDQEITSPEELSKIQAIANGKEVTAVYVGTTTYAKREISQEQKQSLQNVLDAYTYLKEVNKLQR